MSFEMSDGALSASLQEAAQGATDRTGHPPVAPAGLQTSLPNVTMDAARLLC